ncbi:mitochondrial ribonuclease P protein 1 homolog [Harmonia axyridis]|uniref:mitochondrial ribonuclease P protein 1 homolog n=1 Tax=Harmonia axyridis TaxID=115357 RepID=UPI001E275FE9|nr:mitochondrial ribonuclease P protein 1 homolog [Harmonia axyridis]
MYIKEEMKDYDHDAFYIIGAIVDKVNQAPLSLARAKEQNIKMAKFPLDRYLSWAGGSGKSLTLNQVLLILLDLKETGDWKYSLRHVPQRKLLRDEEVFEEMTKKLMRTRRKWSPQTNLNNLGYKYNKNRYETQDSKYPKSRFSVSNSFIKK